MDYSNIILEMLDRIQKLEKDVSELKNSVSDTRTSDKPIEQQSRFETDFSERRTVPYYQPTFGKKDTTRYLFEAAIYPKNRLVLAVVRKYVEDNPNCTVSQLKEIFPKSLQGSIGVVENISIAQMRSDYNVRFFAGEREVLHLADGDMYVCTQWGIANIPNFLARAAQLGYDIRPIT